NHHQRICTNSLSRNRNQHLLKVWAHAAAVGIAKIASTEQDPRLAKLQSAVLFSDGDQNRARVRWISVNNSLVLHSFAAVPPGQESALRGNLTLLAGTGKRCYIDLVAPAFIGRVHEPSTVA